MEWILILTFYAGAMAHTDSVSMTSVGGFKDQAECQAAGASAKSLETMMKSVSFACIKRSK